MPLPHRDFCPTESALGLQPKEGLEQIGTRSLVGRQSPMQECSCARALLRRQGVMRHDHASLAKPPNLQAFAGLRCCAGSMECWYRFGLAKRARLGADCTAAPQSCPTRFASLRHGSQPACLSVVFASENASMQFLPNAATQQRKLGLGEHRHGQGKASTRKITTNRVQHTWDGVMRM